MMNISPHIFEQLFALRSLRSNTLRLASGFLSLIILTACSDGGGGGAGDGNTTTPDQTGTIAVAPLVGTWDLPDDWRGLPNDEAVLLIRSPAVSGVADAVVFDFDDAATGLGENCFRIDGLPGTVSQSLGNEIFMDNISAFPNAVVSLNASGNLVIVYSEDGTTSTNRDTTTLIAEPLGITETDISPLCPN